MRQDHRTALIAVALLVSMSSKKLAAQFPATVAVGSRVRVWLPEPHRQNDGPAHRQLLRGTVLGISPDTLQLTIPGTAGSIAVPRMTIRRMQVSRGSSRLASAFQKAAAGAAGGAAQWALMNDPRRRGGPNYPTDWRAAGVGASWGAGIGAVVGLVFPHEQWRRVRLR